LPAQVRRRAETAGLPRRTWRRTACRRAAYHCLAPAAAKSLAVPSY
jgi:hypothetical protein